ncbi:hypothetical protein HHK36_024737 [Tetracentron sinense]|uniref:Uncharacterized protein n=1 Tax=Tetracentron sinense TaxID=13715 RepID=A0A835D7S1_TETSI|nr:hypothetical protein HHK36_024737 [Tetracentron sinense]
MGEESIHHALLLCSHAKCSWFGVAIPGWDGLDDYLSVAEWWIKIEDSESRERGYNEFLIQVISLLWCIWIAQNGKLFEGRKIDPCATIIRSNEFVVEIQGVIETFDFELSNLFTSQPKGVTSCKAEDIASEELQEFKIEEFGRLDTENSLFESVWRDDRVRLVYLSKRLSEKASNQEGFEGSEDTDLEPIDLRIVSRLLQLCCKFDSVECAAALINGEIGLVPHINEMDGDGRTALHNAAETHATRCIELLLRKGARTDLKSKDGRAQLALKTALSSRRMQVLWNPDDAIEDLLVFLSERDLSSVRILAENTKETTEVAYRSAMEGQIISLAALLMVAAEKVNTSILVLRTDGGSGSKETSTIYECVIREALSLGQWPSSRAVRRLCTSSNVENTEKRRLLLREIELLQQFGAVAQTTSPHKRVTSSLIRASQAGDEAVVKLLVKTNIDLNATDAEGNSALHWCLRTSSCSSPKSLRIAWLLLKHGARVSQRNRLGLNALHFSAANGNFQALQILLLRDPDCVNATTEMKETPLFFAVKNDFMDCAQLLLRYGASSQVLNLRGQRPLDLTKSQDMRSMLSSTNVHFFNRAFPVKQKSTVWLNNDQFHSEIPEAFLNIREEDSTIESCLGAKTEICRYFESPGGCVRGDKCYYAHGEEELRLTRLTKQGTLLVPCPPSEDLKRKIFIGGLPASVDSDTLSEFFEDLFGSVKDAIVIESQAGDHLQSRGFGFVTFKDEECVAAAVKAHFVTIMGKQVEIKSAVPKFTLYEEIPKPLPRQQQEHQRRNQFQLQVLRPKANDNEETRAVPLSWAERLLGGKQKIGSNMAQAQVCTTAGDQTLPSWVTTFSKWLPGFLHEVSKRLREGEWYPLSSLKGDFRATCGLELDHTSLGYLKLSDFMRSFPGICRMKVVPVGGRGPATHMVLLPNLPRPHQQHQYYPIKVPHVSSSVPSLDENDDHDLHDDDNRSLQSLLSVVYGNFGYVGSSTGEEISSSGAPERNLGQERTTSVDSRFLEFLKPDPIFLNRTWLGNENVEETRGGADDGRRGDGKEEEKKPRQHRHVALEALARIQKNSSVFFLREYDFYQKYKASLERGKCFACGKRKMLWANFPCGHLLWCGDCKLIVTREAGTYASEHTYCVVCNANVEKIDLMPWNEICKHQCDDATNDEEFPPYNPDHLRGNPCPPETDHNSLPLHALKIIDALREPLSCKDGKACPRRSNCKNSCHMVLSRH